MNRVMDFINHIVDRNIICEYHNYVNGRCTCCDKVRIGNAIAIIGKNEEQVMDVGKAIIKLSK